MQLRDYQTEAVQACYNHLRTRDDNPCIVIPTGGGKTPALAQICLDATLEWAGRVLILSHVKELLEQAVETLHGIDERLISKVGVYSAGLRRRQTGTPITVAGIQSVYRKATKLGKYDLIIVDEAHLIPTDGEGMYRTFLAEAKMVNPKVRVIGLTATPYRMKDGMICGPENILNHICHETGVRELIARGFLCNLKSRAGSVDVDTDGLHIRAGEFIQQEMEDLMGEDELVEAACLDVWDVFQKENRNRALIFAAGVEHGGKVANRLRELTGESVGEIYGDTPAEERAALVRRFRDGDLRFMVNMNVLTIGFDAPNVDMIALLRPTASPGLYYQMVGRGFRIAKGKDYCRVLDYGNNVLRHGPVDTLKPDGKQQSDGGDAPAKKCDACGALVHAAYRVCPECGADFPKIEKKHATKHGDAAILSGEITVEDIEVAEVFYAIHTKKGAAPDHPKTIKVSYQPAGLRADLISEWVCVEHPEGSFPQRKAAMWWRSRSKTVCPKTVREAIEMAHEGALARPSRIRVEYRPGEKFPRILSADIGELPDYRPWHQSAADLADHADDEAERVKRWQKARAELSSPEYEPPF
jgi:DNA repair protein RadD